MNLKEKYILALGRSEISTRTRAHTDSLILLYNGIGQSYIRTKTNIFNMKLTYYLWYMNLAFIQSWSNDFLFYFINRA